MVLLELARPEVPLDALDLEARELGPLDGDGVPGDTAVGVLNQQLMGQIVISFSYSVLVDDVEHNRHLALEGAEVDVHHSADLEELSEDL